MTHVVGKPAPSNQCLKKLRQYANMTHKYTFLQTIWFKHLLLPELQWPPPSWQYCRSQQNTMRNMKKLTVNYTMARLRHRYIVSLTYSDLCMHR